MNGVIALSGVPTKRGEGFIMRKITTGMCGVALAVAACLPMSAMALDLGAFSDVKWSGSDKTGDTSAFALGGLDFFARQQVTSNTTGFFEFVYENNGDSFVLDVERLWIKRDFNPAFSLAAGRFHAPLGYWNRNFHHGVLLQPSVSRPSFIDFEDGEAAILPMHMIGLMAEGRLGGGLSYEASIGNSTSLDTSAYNPGTTNCGCEIGLGNVSDGSDGKSFVGRVTYSFAGQPLKLSAFGMRNSVVEGGDSSLASTLVPTGNTLFTQTVLGGDVHFDNDVFDVTAEYYNLKNDPSTGVGGSSHTATAYYAQFGYRIQDQVKLGYRYESLSFDSAAGNVDQYFQILGRDEAKHHVIVLRYDLDDTNALTLELNRANLSGSENYTSYILDWSFMLI